MANTITDINIDMIGRRDEAHANTNNYVYVIGADRLSSDLDNITANAKSMFKWTWTTNTMTLLIQITFTNVLTIIILKERCSFCFHLRVHADYHQKRIHQIKLNTTP
jgi:hypothetical protein